ncbi:T9SS type A sorting domain-containing protein [Xanthomarina sp. F1114]|uniref:T9SS type A sorting domain-containing protein n=1 Tax=Xanthomarina sp. F1114 TaxID=2996019 RepID=UPI00225E1E40|nr:T9SS type A sorting domain-containing protein [Xanthomarina sp. F1114]MCX7548395.1 T9SS type A sorting domain-containing protein [Xanthomarina sp. F1114]
MKHLYVRKFSLCANLKKIVFLNFLFFNLIITAQNYPTAVTISSIDYQNYQAPSQGIPDYLSTITNEFGNEVTRISDKDVFGTDGQRLKHHYAKDQPWNSDGSLIKLAGYPAAILDGSTHEFLYWASIPSAATWANTSPIHMYGTSGNTIVRYDVTTNNRVTLHTFSEYNKISYGFNEGNMSTDDRYIGLIGQNGSDLTLIVYDIANDLITGTKHIGSSGDMDWFSVSPSGTYAVVSWRPDGSSSVEGLKVYNIDMTNERHVTDYTTHADLGTDANGDDVYVAFGDNDTRPDSYYLKMVRLSDGLLTPLFHYTTATGVWGGHISCRNTDRPGYAYVTESCCNTHGKREMFAIKLDGSNTIERFGYHHSDKSAGYGHSPMGVPNRDGSKMMFGSNWEDSSIKSDSYPPAFIVQAPESSLNIEDETIATSNIKVYPNPSIDGIVNIKLNGSIVVKTIEVHDMLGRVISTEEMSSNEKSLNLSGLPTGVYLLTFRTEKSGSITKRVVLN